MAVSDLPFYSPVKMNFYSVLLHISSDTTYCVYVHILIFRSDFVFGQKWTIPNNGGSSIIIFFPGKTHSTSSWSQQIVPSIQVLLLKITVRSWESHELSDVQLAWGRKRCFMLLCTFLSSYNMGTKLETLISIRSVFHTCGDGKRDKLEN